FEEEGRSKSLVTDSELIKHTPIHINGNNDFISKSEKEDWKGNGSANNPFIIENYDIDARSAGNAIMISNTDLRFVVKNCMVYNAAFISNPYLAGEGIAVYNASNGVIMKNTVFSNDGDGIDLQKANNITIFNNEALNNYDDGIHITDSSNNMVYENTVSTNDDDGINIDGGSTNNIIKNNTINLNSRYSVFMFYSNENVIENNSIIKSKAGLFISNCKNSVINNNEIEGSGYGIYLLNSNRSKIYSNFITETDYGIYTSYASENIFSDNKLISNEYTGISLRMSSVDNILKNNIISKNRQYGIYITGSGSNKLYNSTIASNKWVGLLIIRSGDNIIRFNNITKNNIGIEIKESSRNLIYNNNFIANMKQASVEGENEWDNGYPTGGNYWSNYRGTDEKRGPDQDEYGSDGIGDTFHRINLDKNIDSYPLITPVKGPSETTKPTSPQSFLVEGGDGYIYLNWTLPEYKGGLPLTEYRVYRGTDEENISLYKTFKYLGTSFTDTEVEYSQTYYYFVKAVNLIGEGNRTSIFSSKSEKESVPPSTPKNISVHHETGNEVRLTWEYPFNNISVTSFHVHRGETSDKKNVVANVSGKTYSYLDFNIKSNASYYYQISAENSAGESNLSEEVVVNISAEYFTPSPPTNITAHENQNSTEIYWSPPENTGSKDIIGYKIYRSTSDGTEHHIATVTDQEEYIDQNITIYRTYNYRISAFNEVGEGESSEKISVKPTFDGSLSENKKRYYLSNWIYIPIITIISLLVIAKLFVITPVIEA
ncbi:MAG: NosD domain-containing protein, partial [Thermoplasmatota archaeon]